MDKKIKENLGLIKKIRTLFETGFVSSDNLIALSVGLYQFTRPFNFDQSYYMQLSMEGRHKTINKYLKNFGLR